MRQIIQYCCQNHRNSVCSHWTVYAAVGWIGIAILQRYFDVSCPPHRVPTPYDRTAWSTFLISQTSSRSGKLFDSVLPIGKKHRQLTLVFSSSPMEGLSNPKFQAAIYRLLNFSVHQLVVTVSTWNWYEKWKYTMVCVQRECTFRNYKQRDRTKHGTNIKKKD